MQWGRYELICWNEWLRVWCHDCQQVSPEDELAVWPEVEAVNLAAVIGHVVAHEMAEHASPG